MQFIGCSLIRLAIRKRNFGRSSNIAGSEPREMRLHLSSPRLRSSPVSPNLTSPPAWEPSALLARTHGSFLGRSRPLSPGSWAKAAQRLPTGEAGGGGITPLKRRGHESVEGAPAGDVAQPIGGTASRRKQWMESAPAEACAEPASSGPAGPRRPGSTPPLRIGRQRAASNLVRSG